MGLTYTRKEIRTRVNDITRDSDTGFVLAAVKNRLISERHRDFVERTSCNRNCVIFSLADGTTDGTLEYDQKTSDRLGGNAPTLAYSDYEGWPSYKLSNCDAIIKIERYVDDNDGNWVEMRPVTPDDVSRMALLGDTTDYPRYYEMLNEGDTFRVLKELATTAYTIKFRIWYMESVIDLITNDNSPIDTTAPTFSGAGLNNMTISTAATTKAGTYVVTVGTDGTPDKYTYTYNGVSGGAAADMATTVTLGTGGPVVAFAATTGHTATNTWTFYQDDAQVGNVPLEYRKAIIWGVVADVFALRGDERWQLWEGKYEREVGRCKASVYIDHYAKPYRIRVTK